MQPGDSNKNKKYVIQTPDTVSWLGIYVKRGCLVLISDVTSFLAVVERHGRKMWERVEHRKEPLSEIERKKC